MQDGAPVTPAGDAAAAFSPAAPGRVSRRALIGGGAGLAGLGARLGAGLLLSERTPGHLADERQRAAHLLRRTGFSPTTAAVDAAVKAGNAATTDSLLTP